MRGSDAKAIPDGATRPGATKQSMALAWTQIGLRFLPFADAVSVGVAARSPAPPVPVPAFRRPRRRAAEWHAEPRDDRGTRCPGLPGRVDGFPAAAVRASARPGRIPLGPPPLLPRLAAGALHLDGHAAPVRRAGDHAFCTAGAVRRHPRARGFRPDWCCTGLSPDRRRPPHQPDGGPRARDRPGSGGHPSAGRGTAVRDAAGRDGRQRCDLRPRCSRTSASSA